ncbi:hypothetical protein AC26_0166 [Escherichia coli 1-176-05_S3_C2]|nr:hypothetical protein AC26_0166 [Escherichia coli 1-176-05_S3_C2]
MFEALPVAEDGMANTGCSVDVFSAFIVVFSPVSPLQLAGFNVKFA